MSVHTEGRGATSSPGTLQSNIHSFILFTGLNFGFLIYQRQRRNTFHQNTLKNPLIQSTQASKGHICEWIVLGKFLTLPPIIRSFPLITWFDLGFLTCHRQHKNTFHQYILTHTLVVITQTSKGHIKGMNCAGYISHTPTYWSLIYTAHGVLFRVSDIPETTQKHIPPTHTYKHTSNGCKCSLVKGTGKSTHPST